MERWHNICKSISIIHEINRMKDKKHMDISTDAKRRHSIKFNILS
jgi:hypothetical protein